MATLELAPQTQTPEQQDTPERVLSDQEFYELLGSAALSRFNPDEPTIDLPTTKDPRQGKTAIHTAKQARKIEQKVRHYENMKKVYGEEALYSPNIFKAKLIKMKQARENKQAYEAGKLTADEYLTEKNRIKNLHHRDVFITTTQKPVEKAGKKADVAMFGLWDKGISKPLSVRVQEMKFPSIDLGRGTLWDRESADRKEKKDKKDLKGKLKKLGATALLSASLRLPAKPRILKESDRVVIPEPLVVTEPTQAKNSSVAESTPVSTVDAPVATQPVIKTEATPAATPEAEPQNTVELGSHTAAVKAEITDRVKSILEDIKEQLGDAYNEEEALAQVMPLVMLENMDKITEANQKDGGEITTDFDPASVLLRATAPVKPEAAPAEVVAETSERPIIEPEAVKPAEVITWQSIEDKVEARVKAEATARQTTGEKIGDAYKRIRSELRKEATKGKTKAERDALWSAFREGDEAAYKERQERRARKQAQPTERTETVQQRARRERQEKQAREREAAASFNRNAQQTAIDS